MSPAEYDTKTTNLQDESFHGREGGSESDLGVGSSGILFDSVTVAEMAEERERDADRLSEIMKSLIGEADGAILLQQGIIDGECTAAYLVSNAVVLMFDVHRGMTSKPLRAFPIAKMLEIVESSLPEVKNLFTKKSAKQGELTLALHRVTLELDRVLANPKGMDHAKRLLPRRDEMALGDLDAEVSKGTEHHLDPIDGVILSAVDAGLSLVGTAGKETVLGLLERRYGLSFEDIPEHPRNFIGIIEEILGPASRTIEAVMVAEIKKSNPVPGDTLYEVACSLKGKKRRPLRSEPEAVDLRSPAEAAQPSDQESAAQSPMPVGQMMVLYQQEADHTTQGL